MWDIHRDLDAGFFSGEYTVPLFEFSDCTSKYRRWWLVIKDGDLDVCLKDPGYEVKLHIFTDRKTLTGVWMGDLSLVRALRNKPIIVTGEDHLKRGMSAW
jgi:hypothetical protein